MRAYVHELFSSLQGEGTHVGEWHVFLRFSGCPLRCIYCDTVQARTVRQTCVVHTSPPSVLHNPVGLDEVLDAIECLWSTRCEFVSLTGGEPLLYPDFILALAEHCPHPLYLETSGVPHSSALRVAHAIDVAACDIKLREHGATSHYEELVEQEIATIHALLESGVEVCVKVVVLERTDVDTIEQAASLLEGLPITLVLQPAAGTVMDMERVACMADAAAEHVEHVRVVPQLHTLLNIR